MVKDSRQDLHLSNLGKQEATTVNIFNVSKCVLLIYGASNMNMYTNEGNRTPNFKLLHNTDSQEKSFYLNRCDITIQG